jgi:hypothetical protein
LAFINFGLPFCLLLARDMKRRPGNLIWVACLLLVAAVVNAYWLVLPVIYAIEAGDLLRGGNIGIHWLDFAALVGLGGITLALFLWQLRTHPLAPPPLPLAQQEETAHA